MSRHILLKTHVTRTGSSSSTFSTRSRWAGLAPTHLHSVASPNPNCYCYCSTFSNLNFIYKSGKQCLLSVIKDLVRVWRDPSGPAVDDKVSFYSASLSGGEEQWAACWLLSNLNLGSPVKTGRAEPPCLLHKCIKLQVNKYTQSRWSNNSGWEQDRENISAGCDPNAPPAAGSIPPQHSPLLSLHLCSFFGGNN